MDTINMSDFYKALNDLLGYVSELDDISNIEENIELGHLEESTTGLEMDEPIRQFALSHYKRQQAEKMLAILSICNELGTYTDVTDDGMCMCLDWTVNRK